MNIASFFYHNKVEEIRQAHKTADQMYAELRERFGEPKILRMAIWKSRRKIKRIIKREVKKLIENEMNGKNDGLHR